MKRSLQEYVELVVFGLVALLVGTGLLWLVGWALSLGGVALRWVAGLLWTLLRFIVPVAIAGGLVYFLVKAAQDRKPATAPAPAPAAGPTPPPPPPSTPVVDDAPATSSSTPSTASTAPPSAAAPEGASPAHELEAEAAEAQAVDTEGEDRSEDEEA
jgi:hypothetical protein